ncbi:hypothetical protein [Streptomyces sp. TRM68416]|uniref:hypothetical protein n=1 Tax=Streptomyces sp. TRM68416 TaxID=2758412 RepID=UPI00166213A6|nr:hypothetical protein [Streptomyces sp. TRM68416]MBD0842022.1 hypothetical protein [Streptomyces sp. TRM68416]
MLLPEGFWMSFTLVVLVGMAATAVAAVQVSVLASGRTPAHRPGPARQASAPPVPVVPLRAEYRAPAPAPQRRAS